MNDSTPNEVLYRVRRFEPGRDQAPHWQDFTIPRTPGMTVLDGLWTIKQTLDPTLSWRSSCRMGVCGSCGMLINGRLSSRWPARGAPVEHQGVVYFGAGIWPEEGVYVCAVEAATGGVRWRSDALSYVAKGMSDHGQAYDLSLPPQGYPAVLDGKLAVTSGRSLAAWFDLETGELEPYTCFYAKTSPPRGTYVTVNEPFGCIEVRWTPTRGDTIGRQ